MKRRTVSVKTYEGVQVKNKRYARVNRGKFYDKNKYCDDENFTGNHAAILNASMKYAKDMNFQSDKRRKEECFKRS